MLKKNGVLSEIPEIKHVTIKFTGCWNDTEQRLL